jgi:beta-glucanase (GH16 family)
MVVVMKHNSALLTSFFVTISLLSFEGQSVAKSNRQTGQYKPVWSDEFNSNGKPNTNNWNFEKDFFRNRELQWYQPDDAFCTDGKLIFEAKNERKRNPNYLSEK